MFLTFVVELTQRPMSNGYINNVQAATRALCRPSPFGVSSTRFVMLPDGREYPSVFDGDFGMVSPPSGDGCFERIFMDGHWVVFVSMKFWDNDAPPMPSRLLNDPRVAAVDWTNPTVDELAMLERVADEFRAIGCEQSDPVKLEYVILGHINP